MGEDKKASKSERTRRRILHAAARIFRQVGYTAASLRDIAEEAEMQAGSLYYHFDSKEELAEVIMDEAVVTSRRRAQAAAETVGPNADGLTRLSAALHAYLVFLLEESDAAVATLRMLQQTPEAIRERNKKKQRASGRFWEGLLKQAQEEGLIRADADLSAIRMLLLGALNWTPEWFDEHKASPAEIIAQLEHILRFGLGQPDFKIVKSA